MATAAFLTTITAFRNPNGPESKWNNMAVNQRQPAKIGRIATVELGYLIAIPFAVVETAISAIATIFAHIIDLCINDRDTNEMCDGSVLWLQMSASSIPWAFAGSLLNIFSNDMMESGQNTLLSLRNLSVLQQNLETNPKF